jgi:hypothetical protein
VSALRYWTCASLGVAVSAAAVAAISWGTFALTSQSLCAPGDDRLGCELGGDRLAAVMAVAFFVAIPLGSNLFAWRSSPRGGGLGLLAIALGLTGACGAALTVGIGSPGTSAELPGLLTGILLAIVAPFVLLGGLVTTFSNLDPRARALAVAKAHSARAAAREPRADTDGNGGSVSLRSTVIDGRADPRAANDALAAVGLGDLAAQLSQIAAARARTDGDSVATKLRQLDDLRASGLLTPEEHARKRRELLDAI